MTLPNAVQSDSHSPHQGQPVRTAGASIQDASAAVVLFHGRGGTAGGILPLADDLDQSAATYRAPQASDRTWYPHSFLAPLQQNEPHLSSALQAASDVVATLDDNGIPPQKTMLVGFSQGACLALEFAARHAGRYGGVVAFSGGLIGNGKRDAEPPDDKTFGYDGSLDGTPVFLGCSDRDPHIPLRRVEQTAEALERHGAAVTKQIYEGMGHTIIADEIEHARTLLDRLINTPL